MVVHHVEVDQVGAGVDHRAHFLAEAREIGGQERRRDAIGAHASGTIIAENAQRAKHHGGEQTLRDHGRRRRSRILADQSDPAKNHFVFAYTITITNTGSVAAQLDQPALDHHRRASIGSRK